ncbi:MAG: hypothetical protein ABSC61_01895 [Anaerolineales bacterium]
MKKVFILFSIMALILILSVGIKDSILTLTNDINNHLWLNLVGRWHSSENAHHEIEFYPDGTFIEKYSGVAKGFGDYQVNDNSIVLIYDLSSCSQETGNSCTVYMKLYYDFTTIKLINNENKMIFNKMGGH